jgi:hypothetical protein
MAVFIPDKSRLRASSEKAMRNNLLRYHGSARRTVLVQLEAALPRNGE